jgi:hypothetical protein
MNCNGYRDTKDRGIAEKNTRAASHASSAQLITATQTHDLHSKASKNRAK